uniref:Uncharacterized protein n=1 Tax=Caenorhabditis tropicalis TaxID=1561998 RepID=A0A1I7V3V1_9PELO
MGKLFLFSLCILVGCLSAGPLPSRKAYGPVFGCPLLCCLYWCPDLYDEFPQRAFARNGDPGEDYYNDYSTEDLSDAANHHNLTTEDFNELEADEKFEKVIKKLKSEEPKHRHKRSFIRPVNTTFISSNERTRIPITSTKKPVTSQAAASTLPLDTTTSPSKTTEKPEAPDATVASTTNLPNSTDCPKTTGNPSTTKALPTTNVITRRPILEHTPPFKLTTESPKITLKPIILPASPIKGPNHEPYEKLPTTATVKIGDPGAA